MSAQLPISPIQLASAFELVNDQGKILPASKLPADDPKGMKRLARIDKKFVALKMGYLDMNTQIVILLKFLSIYLPAFVKHSGAISTLNTVFLQFLFIPAAQPFIFRFIRTDPEGYKHLECMLRGDSSLQWTPIESPSQLEGSKQLLEFFHQYVKHCLSVAFFVAYETKQRSLPSNTSSSSTLPPPKLSLSILKSSIVCFQELHDDLTTRHLNVLATFPSNAFAAPAAHSHDNGCNGSHGGGAVDGRAIVVRHVKACQEDILELVKILKKAVAGGGVMAEPTKEEEEGQPWMICEARDLGSNVESGCVAVGGPGGGKKELLACGKCLSSRYCSAEHQKAHWSQHKVACFKPTW